MNDSLDEILSRYSQVEVPADLDQRILQSVKRAGHKRKVAVIAGTFATLAASMALFFHPAKKLSEPTLQTSLLIEPVELSIPNLKIVSLPRRLHTRPAPPKLDVFPSPSPLTAEERTLVHMVQNYPEQTEKLFAAAARTNNDPIEIKPIVIAPLPQPTPIGETR